VDVCATRCMYLIALLFSFWFFFLSFLCDYGMPTLTDSDSSIAAFGTTHELGKKCAKFPICTFPSLRNPCLRTFTCACLQTNFSTVLVEVKRANDNDDDYFSDKVFVFRANSAAGVVGTIRVSVSYALAESHKFHLVVRNVTASAFIHNNVMLHMLTIYIYS